MASFKGREKELNILLDDFWACAGGRDGQAEPTPQMTVIVAESGIGKSRLVQELYAKLSQEKALNQFEYWPPKFGDDDNKLRTQPIMRGHIPKGPPQFIWLGARWSDPDDRNFDERQSILPHVIEHIDQHIAIREKHAPSWKKYLSSLQRATKLDRDSIAEEGTGIVIEKLLDADVIPFGGLLYRVAKETYRTSKGIARDKGWLDAETEVADKTATEELLKMMATIFSQSHPVPMVLWLDDAQWLDAESADFLQQFWERAVTRRWPLHIVITHWEREWNIGISDEGNPFTAFIDQHKTRYLPLSNASPEMLRAYVQENLPNLTDAQDRLIVEKAGGNFLSMIENMGELCRHQRNFVNNDFNQPLSEVGEKRVEKWESKREARVKQRFDELEDEVQDILGWCSRIGHRFFQEVVRDFAQQAHLDFQTDKLLQTCVTPYAVLADLRDDAHQTLELKEFRDKAYLHVARQHYEAYLKIDRADCGEILQTVIRAHLARWIENSLDETGNLLPAMNDETLPAHCLQALTVPEMIDFMALAGTEFNLPTPFDAANSDHQLAIKLHLAAFERYQQLNAWTEIYSLCNRLLSLAWETIPESVVPFDQLKTITNTVFTAGWASLQQPYAQRLFTRALQADQTHSSDHTQRHLAIGYGRMGDMAATGGDLATARANYEAAFAIDQTLAAQQGTPQSQRDLAVSLGNLGQLAEKTGDLVTAQAHQQAALTLRQTLAAQQGTPQSQCDLAVSLDSLGRLAEKTGDLVTAQVHQQAALILRQTLAAQQGTPQSQRDLAVSLGNLGQLAATTGDLATARTNYEAAFAIFQKLVDQQGTPQSQRDLAISLDRLGWLAEETGDLATARVNYEAAFAICQKLADQQGTPESQRDLAASLYHLGRLAETTDDLATARVNYKAVFAICQMLAAQQGTPESQRDLAISLDRLGWLAEKTGDLATAQAHQQAALTLRQTLADQQGTPESQGDLAVSLAQLGDLAKKTGDLDTARTNYEAAFAIFQKLVDQQDTPDNQNNLAVCLARIDNLAEETDGVHYETDQKLAEQQGTPDNQRDLAIDLYSLGQVAETTGDLDSARANYEAAFAIFQKLDKQEETPDSQRDLSIGLGKLGGLARQTGDWVAARAHYVACLEIQQKLAAQQTPMVTQSQLLALHWHLAMINHQLNDVDATWFHINSAFKIRSTLFKQAVLGSFPARLLLKLIKRSHN